MNTLLMLMAQFNKVILSQDDVVKLTGLCMRSLQNMTSRGEFPSRLPGGGYPIQDIATWIDERRSHRLLVR